MKLLIVEDEPNFRQLSAKDFQKNHEVSVALDGLATLGIYFQNHNFDVVILDVMLPDINGIEICRRLRAAKTLFHFDLLTALGSTENIINGLNSRPMIVSEHLQELVESQRTFQTSRSNTKTE
jgi:DNA-binding response OmpR family regulator